MPAPSASTRRAGRTAISAPTSPFLRAGRFYGATIGSGVPAGSASAIGVDGMAVATDAVGMRLHSFSAAVNHRTSTSCSTLT